MKTKSIMLTALLAGGMLMAAPSKFASDTFKTSAGDVTITFIGHGTLMMQTDGTVIHVDPWTKQADYTQLPKADIILITHDHRDHLDPAAIEQISKASTQIIASAVCDGKAPGAVILKNGESRTVGDIAIDAVPAYNIKHMREGGGPFHPKGDGNGYVLTIGDKKFYIAGDTEDIPEMKELNDIAVAFIPMNLPYTMTPEMTANAAKSFMPKILYPYHFGSTDTKIIVKLLKNSGIEVRIRNLE